MPTAAKRYRRENDFDAIVAGAAARHGVPVPLIKAVIAVESEFTPGAMRREPHTTSYGLMQVTPGAAGLTEAEGRTLLDPTVNIDKGTRFLSALLRRFGGDEARALSAYNGGDRPSIGFGTKAVVPVRICLAWKPGTPATGRTIAQHCAKPRDVKPGEFGNQPYVDKALGLRRYFAGASSPALTMTTTQARVALAMLLGVAAVAIVQGE